MNCFTVNHNHIKASSIHLLVIIKRGDKLDIKAVCSKNAKYFPITVTCKRAMIQSYTLLEKISDIFAHKLNDNFQEKKNCELHHTLLEETNIGLSSKSEHTYFSKNIRPI